MSHRQSGNTGGYGGNQGLPPRPPPQAPWTRNNNTLSQGLQMGPPTPLGPPPGPTSYTYFPSMAMDPNISASNFSMPPPPTHLPADFSRFLVRDRPLLETQVVPGASYVSPVQLQVAHSYGFYRGNGQYTRLIPADQVQYLNDADLYACRTYQGPEGLIILPHPTAPTPEVRARQGRNLLVPVQVVNQIYDENTRFPNTFGRDQSGRFAGAPHGNVQGYIDQVVHRAVKPEKIWCSKWVLQGVCAFTQTGCRYRHEMPDLATLESLYGLQSLPDWYVRKHRDSNTSGSQSIAATPSTSLEAFNQDRDAQESAAGGRGRVMSSSWRGHHKDVSLSAMSDAQPIATYGPIQPPPYAQEIRHNDGSPVPKGNRGGRRKAASMSVQLSPSAMHPDDIPFRGRKRQSRPQQDEDSN